MEYVLWGIGSIVVYVIIRSLILYYNYRKSLTLYRNVLKFLKKYPDEGIGWYLSMASALIKCQQYADAHYYLTESKAKFSDFIKERPNLSNEIDINIEFCNHPIGKSSLLRNRITNWEHYVMVCYLGNLHYNYLSKQTMERVKSWIQAGKP